MIACLGAMTLLAAPPVDEGKTIFTSRCAGCHNINKTITGPALAGLDERRSLEWITRFIRSSQALIKAGDKDAIEVYEKFNKIPMPDHADLTDAHISSILEYIKSESKPVETNAAPFARPSKLRPAYLPLSLKDDYGILLGFLGAVVLLIVALLFAVKTRQYGDRQ